MCGLLHPWSEGAKKPPVMDDKGGCPPLHRAAKPDHAVLRDNLRIAVQNSKVKIISHSHFPNREILLDGKSFRK